MSPSSSAPSHTRSHSTDIYISSSLAPRSHSPDIHSPSRPAVLPIYIFLASLYALPIYSLSSPLHAFPIYVFSPFLPSHASSIYIPFRLPLSPYAVAVSLPHMVLPRTNCPAGSPAFRPARNRLSGTLAASFRSFLVRMGKNQPEFLQKTVKYNIFAKNISFFSNFLLTFFPFYATILA